MTCKHIILSLFIVILVPLAGCKHNIAHIDGTVNFPSEYIIDAPLEQTWRAAVEAVLESTTIATMDSRTGYISSDLAVVDGQELSPIDQALLGQTYKYAYIIQIKPEGTTRTRVTAKVRLLVEQFMGMLKSEIRTETVENYLQAKLHTTICDKIFPDTGGNCMSGSTSHVWQEPRPDPPAQVPAKPADGGRPVHDPRVQTSQKVLAKLGYATGPKDGIMGRKTKKALMAFQGDNGLTVTGDLDDATFSLLQNGGVPKDMMQTDKVDLSDGGDAQVSDEAAQGLLSLPGNFESTVDSPGVDQQAQQKDPAPAEAKPMPATARSPIFETGENTALLQDADLYGADILDTIPEGTALEVVDRQGEYYRVRYQGKEGFVIESAVREH